MTTDFSVEDFGLAQTFWAMVEHEEPADDLDKDGNSTVNVLGLRVNFKRKTRAVEEKMQALLLSSAAELDENIHAWHDVAKLDAEALESDAERVEAMRELRHEIAARRDKGVFDMKVARLDLFINDWDYKTISGKSVEFNNLEHREALVRMVPNIVDTLLDEWFVLTSKKAVRKNS